MVTVETIRALIVAEAANIGYLATDADALPDDFDLRLNGVIDSLGFIELIGALQDRLGLDFDLGDLPPEQLTVLAPLARAIARQVAVDRGDTATAEALR